MHNGDFPHRHPKRVFEQSGTLSAGALMGSVEIYTITLMVIDIFSRGLPLVTIPEPFPAVPLRGFNAEPYPEDADWPLLLPEGGHSEITCAGVIRSALTLFRPDAVVDPVSALPVAHELYGLLPLGRTRLFA